MSDAFWHMTSSRGCLISNATLKISNIFKTRLRVAYGDRLALQALVSLMVWTRFWIFFDFLVFQFFRFFDFFRFFPIFSDFRFSDFFSLQSVFLMPQITCIFGSDRLNHAKVEKRDTRQTDRQTQRKTNVYFNRMVGHSKLLTTLSCLISVQCQISVHGGQNCQINKRACLIKF